jgi:hypothetical protein
MLTTINDGNGTIQSNSTLQTDLKQDLLSHQPFTNTTTQQAGITDDYDDDLMKEGYLPEIYFSLKSDNPAEW